jgi:hypothetical protein
MAVRSFLEWGFDYLCIRRIVVAKVSRREICFDSVCIVCDAQTQSGALGNLIGLLYARGELLRNGSQKGAKI